MHHWSRHCYVSYWAKIYNTSSKHFFFYDIHFNFEETRTCRCRMMAKILYKTDSVIKVQFLFYIHFTANESLNPEIRFYAMKNGTFSAAFPSLESFQVARQSRKTCFCEGSCGVCKYVYGRGPKALFLYLWWIRKSWCFLFVLVPSSIPGRTSYNVWVASSVTVYPVA